MWMWYQKYVCHTRIPELEIKPCGLGSRIRDMEADMVNIFDLHGGC